MAAKKNLTKRAGAYKNKVGNRDGGRPVRAIKSKELLEMRDQILAGADVRYRRDRNIIMREIARRERNGNLS